MWTCKTRRPLIPVSCKRSSATDARQAMQAGEIKLPSALPQVDLTHLTREQQESFNAASTPNIRKFFESQQEPVNVNRAEEFLMTAGGRARDTIMSRGQR